MKAPSRAPDPLDFFGHLVWIDGRPLTQVIEPYRAQLFRTALYTFDSTGRPMFNNVLAGRAKKNWKTGDLVLAMLYRFLAWPSPAGNDCFLLANDEGQAADDLALLKKLIQANLVLEHEVSVQTKAIVRNDRHGTLSILPAKDVAGAHGKTYLMAGFDEIHGYRSYDLFEALAPDPTRPDALTWITSYASLFNSAGAPLHDMIATGKRGDDPRMCFSWYSADYTTDPAFENAEPEARANPSASSWPQGDYLAQQRRRLPAHKFRRLHLNLPGMPDGGAFSPEQVQDCVAVGCRQVKPRAEVRYYAFVDMAGGTSDDATLAIAHLEDGRVILDLVTNQGSNPPFNPRRAVARFADFLGQYGLTHVTGDRFAGATFESDFRELGIAYDQAPAPKSDLYEALEPKLNAREVELLDVPKLIEQLLGLVWRGTRIDHRPGEHDDWANAVAGAVALASPLNVMEDLTDAKVVGEFAIESPDSPYAGIDHDSAWAESPWSD